MREIRVTDGRATAPGLNLTPTSYHAATVGADVVWSNSPWSCSCDRKTNRRLVSENTVAATTDRPSKSER
ncbi:hypothetical protein L2E82_20604 [Cichorium intybus]|uniref:Uncharacterized protein n=1 Tax=Cichorium intybus TaxID=13427 RepID=A0ACB9DU79_CICIN|nr:hypothetical protein L2E82_20604 [Cichorium intybus]